MTRQLHMYCMNFECLNLITLLICCNCKQYTEQSSEQIKEIRAEKQEEVVYMYLTVTFYATALHTFPATAQTNDNFHTVT